MSKLSVIEGLVLPEPKKLIRGSGVVETFDERGRTVQKVPFENYIGPAATRYMRWVARRTVMAFVGQPAVGVADLGYSGGSPVYGTNNLDVQWALSPFRGIWATDYTAAETPTERFCYGALIAEAYPSQPQNAAKRGQMNPGECAGSYARAKYVWDWPTNSGIGTFQSLYWPMTSFVLAPTDVDRSAQYASFSQESAWLTLGNNYVATSLSFAGASSSSVLTKGCAIDGADSFWSINSNAASGEVVQRKMSDGSFLAKWSLSAFPACSIAWDGTQLWIGESTSGTGRIRRYDTTGTVLATYANPSGGTSACLGLAWDGTNIFAFYMVSGSGKIYKLNPSTGATVATYTLTYPPINTDIGYTSMVYVPFDGGQLWIGYAGIAATSSQNFTGVLAFDRTGNYITQLSGFPGPYSLGFRSSDERIFSVFGSSGGTSTAFIYSFTDPQSVGARTLLASPVTKSNLQTMKITYQFDIT